MELFDGFFGAFPERGADVGVEGDEASVFLCEAQGVQGGGTDAGVGHGDGTEVEGFRVPEEGGVDFAGCEHHVGSGIAVEGEVAVAVFVVVDEGQGGVLGGVEEDVACADAAFFECLPEVAAELVMADFGDHGGAESEPGEHGEEVSGCSAGVGFEQAVALFADAGGGEVDEKFAHGDDVECLVFGVHGWHQVDDTWYCITGSRFRQRECGVVLS